MRGMGIVQLQLPSVSAVGVIQHGDERTQTCLRQVTRQPDERRQVIAGFKQVGLWDVERLGEPLHGMEIRHVLAALVLVDACARGKFIDACKNAQLLLRDATRFSCGSKPERKDCRCSHLQPNPR